MPTPTHRRHLLTSLLLVVMFIGANPSSVDADDIYFRANQTNADYEPERIEKVISLLKSNQVQDRTDACWKLQELGSEARPAVANLMRLLNDESDTSSSSLSFLPLNQVAGLTLVSIESDAVATLVKAFPKASPVAKRLIARTATRVGTDARELLPSLRKEYDPGDEDSRTIYLFAMASIDPTGETVLPLLLQTLQTAPDAWVRQSAAHCLRCDQTRSKWSNVNSQAYRWLKVNPDRTEQIVGILLKALENEDPGVRAEVMRTLATYPQHQQQVVPELIPLLDDGSSFTIVTANCVSFGLVSDVAIETLRQFPDSAEKSVPALIEWSLRGNPYLAEEVLAELIPRTTEPLKQLRTLLNGERPELALLTIARMGQSVQPLVARVGPLMNSNDLNVALEARLTLACLDERWQSESIALLEEEYASQSRLQFKQESLPFSFLAKVGANASFVTPVTRRCLNMLNKESQFYSSVPSLHKHLVQILANTSSAEPRNISSFLSDEYLVDLAGVEASLVEMCPEAEPGLIAHLSKQDCPPQHRILCLRVLDTVHAKNPELVPLVISQLKSDHPAVRESVVEALGGIATKNEQSVNALIESLDDPRVRVRVKVLESLAKFGADAKPAMPKIIERLSDNYLTVRIAAVRCLGELGPTAATAIDELEKLKNSDSLLLRETGVDAIEQIGSK